MQCLSLLLRLQEFKADVMLAEIQNPCTPLLAHVLDLPWVNHWPLAPIGIDFDRSQGRALAHIMVSLIPQHGCFVWRSVM